MNLLTQRVRVKSKRLLSALLLLFLPLAGWYLAGPDLLYGLAQRASRGQKPVQALALYDRLLQYFPRSHRAPDALYWSAQLLPDRGDFAAYFFPRTSGWRGGGGIEALPTGIAGREERLRRLLDEYPASWPSRWHVPYVLGQDLLKDGKTAAGIDLLKRAVSDPESHQVVPAARALQLSSVPVLPVQQ